MLPICKLHVQNDVVDLVVNLIHRGKRYFRIRRIPVVTANTECARDENNRTVFPSAPRVS